MSEIERLFSKRLLNFSGRRNRLSFLLASLTSFGIFVGAMMTGIVFDSSGTDDWTLVFFVIGVIVAAWINLSIITQRLKDIGLSPWWLIGVIVAWSFPIAGLIVAILLLVWPGETGDNAYGPEPLKASYRLPHILQKYSIQLLLLFIVAGVAGTTVNPDSPHLSEVHFRVFAGDFFGTALVWALIPLFLSLIPSSIYRLIKGSWPQWFVWLCFPFLILLYALGHA